METFSLWVFDDELAFTRTACLLLYALDLLKVQPDLLCMVLCCLICPLIQYRVQIHL